ncbi:MAG TPA: transposase [Thermodesulfovibrionales bacterium]|nr:transposase [Thermodesulfovibrionales bacterium]
MTELFVGIDIDPTVYQSGKYEGSRRISKRGNRYLRKHFFKKRIEGQPFK